MKRFLMTTAFVAATALPMSFAYAQSSSDSTSPQTPSATPTPAAPAANAPAGNSAPADNGATSGATAATPTPPPSDAIIAAQGSSDINANKIIGMRVYNPNGDEVAKVKDVLIDPNGSIKGVVLNVGGVLGVGAKPVGLQWKEVDVEPSNDVVKVNYTKEQLEAAPRFETPDTAAQSDTSSQPAQPMTPSTPAPSSAPAQQ